MCLMSSFYVFQDKILKEIESDGYEIVEAKPVQGTGRKVGRMGRMGRMVGRMVGRMGRTGRMVGRTVGRMGRTVGRTVVL